MNCQQKWKFLGSALRQAPFNKARVIEGQAHAMDPDVHR